MREICSAESDPTGITRSLVNRQILDILWSIGYNIPGQTRIDVV